MKVVFVGGPFSGNTPEEQEQNILRTEELAIQVAEAGAMPICPNSLGRSYKGSPPYEFWIEGTKEILRRCDAMIVTPDYATSSGTKQEIIEAVLFGIKVLYSIEDLKEWLRNS